MEVSDCNCVSHEIQGPIHHTHVTEHYYIRNIKLCAEGETRGIGLGSGAGDCGEKNLSAADREGRPGEGEVGPAVTQTCNYRHRLYSL